MARICSASGLSWGLAVMVWPSMIRLLWSLVWVGAVSLIVSTMLFGQGAGVNRLAWLGTGLVLYALVAIVRAALKARAFRRAVRPSREAWDALGQAERDEWGIYAFERQTIVPPSGSAGKRGRSP